VRRPLAAVWLSSPRLRWFAKLSDLRAYGASIRRDPRVALTHLFVDPEVDNFTYPIANEAALIEFVATSVGLDRREVQEYVAQAHTDDVLRQVLRPRIPPWRRKRTLHPGRRLAWFSFARALKPAVVVETGIHNGLGSVLLLRALELNAAEGSPGRLISFDINAHAGRFVPESLRANWKPVFEPTYDSLERELAGLEVGMVIHDSDHTYECEHFEMTTAIAHAAPRLALVSDNAHATTALRDVCASLGVPYHFFKEEPRNHFYPGAGVGFGLLDRREAAQAQ
jgi:hypothetical protein